LRISSREEPVASRGVLLEPRIVYGDVRTAE
jgi:hypothetical protein